VRDPDVICFLSELHGTDQPGCYLFWSDLGAKLYCGSSVNVERRVRCHLSARENKKFRNHKIFNVWIWFCPEYELEMVEKQIDRDFIPVLNQRPIKRS
jgi:excinuclease UvrABC nuclease subunit